jgi:putrescine importer
VTPLLDVALTLYQWTRLSRLTCEIGLAWAALGFLYLLYLTRLFRRKLPAMHTGEEPDPVSAR